MASASAMLRLVLAALLLACETPSPTVADLAEVPPPPAAPLAPIRPLPQHLELDARRVALGKRLFEDPALSVDGSLSCATCHPLDRGGSDGRSHSRAPGGAATALNTPTIFNVGFDFRWNWNGEFESLESELDAPVTKALRTDWKTLRAKVAQRYRADFATVYGDPGSDGEGGPSEASIRDALATYERSLYTPNARFDRFLAGDQTALTVEEQHGWRRFQELGCVSCHQGQNIGGNLYERIGVLRDFFGERAPVEGTRTPAEEGRYNVTHQERDRHVFRVPSLRNVARTAPYFHDGSAATLGDAVDAMARYQLGRSISPEDLAELVLFLKTLTGEPPPS